MTNLITQHPVDQQVLYVGAQWIGIFKLMDWLLQIQPHFNQTLNCILNQDAIYLILIIENNFFTRQETAVVLTRMR